MTITKLPENKYIWGLFFVTLLFALLTNIGLVSLIGEEPRRALVALEMFLSDEYITPKINGVYYYNKPPVFNWLLVAFASVFESFGHTILRLPSVICFLAIALINYRIVRRKINKQVAAVSSLLFLSCFNLLLYFFFRLKLTSFIR